jgi:hypothetical protein
VAKNSQLFTYGLKSRAERFSIRIAKAAQLCCIGRESPICCESRLAGKTLDHALATSLPPPPELTGESNGNRVSCEK